MTPARAAAIAQEIMDLDAEIIDHDHAAQAARLRRRTLRARLKREGWSWRELGALSGQSMFAVSKDTQRLESRAG